MTHNQLPITCPTCGTRIDLSKDKRPEPGRVLADPADRDLVWQIGPDRDMNWYQAREWVNSLKNGDWRMPTIEELKGMEHRLPSMFQTSGWWIWSGEKDGPLSAMGLDITRHRVDKGGRELDSGGRVFAVRVKLKD